MIWSAAVSLCKTATACWLLWSTVSKLDMMNCIFENGVFGPNWYMLFRDWYVNKITNQLGIVFCCCFFLFVVVFFFGMELRYDTIITIFSFQISFQMRLGPQWVQKTATTESFLDLKLASANYFHQMSQTSRWLYEISLPISLIAQNQ